MKKIRENNTNHDSSNDTSVFSLHDSSSAEEIEFAGMLKDELQQEKT